MNTWLRLNYCSAVASWLQVCARMNITAITSCDGLLPSSQSVRRAAPLITAQTIIHLRQLNTAIESTLEQFDFRGYMNYNLQFHQAIVETCPNAYLRELWRTTTERIHALRGLMASGFANRAREAFEEHKKLIGLIEEKARPEIIERVARSHIERALERFFKNRSA